MSSKNDQLFFVLFHIILYAVLTIVLKEVSVMRVKHLVNVDLVTSIQ